ncbi:unnamed protein product [Musa acuminata var. zebrina]
MDYAVSLHISFKSIITSQRDSEDKTNSSSTPVMQNLPMFEGETLDGAEELIELGFGLGVHTDDDDEGDKAVVGDHLGLLHRPSAPLLHALGRRRPLLRTLGPLPGLPFPFERSLGSHGSSRPFPSPTTLASIAEQP